MLPDDPGQLEFLDEEIKIEDSELENDFYSDSPSDYNVEEK